jgi:hypothetical protein
MRGWGELGEQIGRGGQQAVQPPCQPSQQAAREGSPGPGPSPLAMTALICGHAGQVTAPSRTQQAGCSRRLSAPAQCPTEGTRLLSRVGMLARWVLRLASCSRSSATRRARSGLPSGRCNGVPVGDVHRGRREVGFRSCCHTSSWRVCSSRHAAASCPSLPCPALPCQTSRAPRLPAHTCTQQRHRWGGRLARQRHSSLHLQQGSAACLAARVAACSGEPHA